MNDAVSERSFVERFAAEPVKYHEIEQAIMAKLATAKVAPNAHQIQEVGELAAGVHDLPALKGLNVRYGTDEAKLQYRKLCLSLEYAIEKYVMLNIPHDGRLDMRDALTYGRERVDDRLIALGVEDQQTRENVLSAIDSTITGMLKSKGLDAVANDLGRPAGS